MTLEECITGCVVEAARRTTRVQLRECDGFARAKQARVYGSFLDEYERRFRTWILKTDQQLALCEQLGETP